MKLIIDDQSLAFFSAKQIFEFCRQIKTLTLPEWNSVAQWLGCCATNRKVASLIPAGVIAIFH